MEKIAQLLNTATDGVGNYCLQVAGSFGSCTFFSLSYSDCGFYSGVLEGEWEGWEGMDGEV